MTLEAFLHHNQIILSKDVLSTCLRGISIMAHGTDPLHTADHVFRMLDDLDLMRQKIKSINWSKINYEVLLLAIVWHDTYKSGHFPKTKRRMFFDHVLAEGIASMRMFTREAKKQGINPKIIKTVRYAIRKHSMFQILPRRTQEAKVLKYLDELEDWSLPRFQHIIDHIHSFSDLAPRLSPIIKFYFTHVMLRRNGNRHFPVWVQSEYRRRKSAFARGMADKVKASFHQLRSHKPV